MRERKESRSSFRVLLIGAAVAVAGAAHAAHAQQTICYDGTVAWGVPCPANPNPGPTRTPAPSGPTAPFAPKLTSLAYVTGVNAVKLVWTAPASNGGSPITYYLATHLLGGVKGNTYRLPGTILTTQMPCVSLVSCGYVVAAQNAAGVGPVSNNVVISKTKDLR